MKNPDSLKMNKQRVGAFEEFKIKFNEIEVEELFKKYEEIGFIYPAKKTLLDPYFNLIIQNWEKLLKSNKDLLWILTKEQTEKRHFASVSVWKQSNYGLLAQHLVSNGNPFLSLKVMLAAQFRAEHYYGPKEVQSSQNWFRPDNRYAYRVFASMYDKLGPENASLIRFQYLHLKLDQIPRRPQSVFTAEEVNGRDPKLIAFVKRQYGEVFVRAEELDREDIQLSGVGALFHNHGLKRSRKVLKIRDSRTQKILAVIIANRAPLGLNFSFLENRSYYILDKNLENDKRGLVLKAMNAAIKPYYKDFDLQAIPIVTDALSAKALQSQKATLFREYIQSIWMREGFSLWYNHIHSFLKRIERIEKK